MRFMLQVIADSDFGLCWNRSYCQWKDILALCGVCGFMQVENANLSVNIAITCLFGTRNKSKPYKLVWKWSGSSRISLFLSSLQDPSSLNSRQWTWKRPKDCQGTAETSTTPPAPVRQTPIDVATSDSSLCSSVASILLLLLAADLRGGGWQGSRSFLAQRGINKALDNRVALHGLQPLGDAPAIPANRSNGN